MLACSVLHRFPHGPTWLKVPCRDRPPPPSDPSSSTPGPPQKGVLASGAPKGLQGPLPAALAPALSTLCTLSSADDSQEGGPCSRSTGDTGEAAVRTGPPLPRPPRSPRAVSP